MKFDDADEFSRFVSAIVKKEQLLQGLFDFLELAKKNNIDIEYKIAFLGEYQRLLFESIILDISYVLLDKLDKTNDRKSKMQVELAKVEDKLSNDINNDISNVNYTATQKKDTLKELKSITGSREYEKAISAIATTRDKFIAHKEPNFSGGSLVYEQLLLVIKNIKRCHEIRQLVINNCGKLCISSPFCYNNQNIIEALILQREIKALRDNGKYDKKLWETQKRFYSDNLDFWNTEIKSLMTVEGDGNEQV